MCVFLSLGTEERQKVFVDIKELEKGLHSFDLSQTQSQINTRKTPWKLGGGGKRGLTKFSQAHYNFYDWWWLLLKMNREFIPTKKSGSWYSSLLSAQP